MSIEVIAGTAMMPKGIEKSKRVLVCATRYLPGYKSGGPIRAVSNMVTNLSPRFDFYVVTRDRDATDTDSYPGVTPNRWHQVGNAKVLYCASVETGILRRAYQEVQPDIISLNSFQDSFTRVMVLLRRGGVFGNTPVILAPRGEFSPGARSIKRVKKVLYRRIAKLLGLHENLIWQVSTPREKSDLLRAGPARHLDPDKIHVAYEISDAIPSTDPHATKEPGTVKLAFVARMSEMKNLHFLLDILREVRGNVQLNLFGPVADNDLVYWETCKAAMKELPANIQVDYRGPLDHAAVPQVLHEHHFFVLPTKGENFCHAAVEALVNGTPVILSDETPWTGLSEVSAGFDLPLNDRTRWISALQECVDMGQEAYAVLLNGAAEYGRRFSPTEAVRQHLVMLEAAIAGRSQRAPAVSMPAASQ